MRNEIGRQQIVAMSIEIDCGRWGGEATLFYLSQFIDWFTEYNDANASKSASMRQSSMMASSSAQTSRLTRTSNRSRREAGLLQDDFTGPDSGMSFGEAAPVEAVVKANAANPD
jgi:hypothetical protein